MPIEGTMEVYSSTCTVICRSLEAILCGFMAVQARAIRQKQSQQEKQTSVANFVSRPVCFHQTHSDLNSPK